jgi:hypothetical protein
LFFEKSHYIAQGLEFMILLPHLPSVGITGVHYHVHLLIIFFLLFLVVLVADLRALHLLGRYFSHTPSPSFFFFFFGRNVLLVLFSQSCSDVVDESVQELKLQMFQQVLKFGSSPVLTEQWWKCMWGHPLRTKLFPWNATKYSLASLNPGLSHLTSVWCDQTVGKQSVCVWGCVWGGVIFNWLMNRADIYFVSSETEPFIIFLTLSPTQTHVWYTCRTCYIVFRSSAQWKCRAFYLKND